MFSCYLNKDSAFVGCSVYGKSSKPELVYNKDNAGPPSWGRAIKVKIPDHEPEEVVMGFDLIQSSVSVNGLHFKDLLTALDIKEIVPGEWAIDDVRKVGSLVASGILITDKDRKLGVDFKRGKLTIEEHVFNDNDSLLIVPEKICSVADGLECFNIKSNFTLFLMAEIFRFPGKDLSFGMFNVYHENKLITLPLRLDKEDVDGVVNDFEELLRGLE